MVLGFSIITFLVVDDLALKLQILQYIVGVAVVAMVIPALGRMIERLDAVG